MKKVSFILIASMFVLSLNLSGLATAETVQEQEIDLQVRAIAKTLRCTICQNESIWESQAELAHQMRDLIKEKLSQGETPDQIRAYFLSRYGDYILLAPRKRGLNWLLWAGPFVLLGGGGVFLYFTISRWVAQARAAKSDPPEPIDDHVRKRIEAELESRED